MLRKLSVSLVACHCFVLTFAQLEPGNVTVTAYLKNADSTNPRAMVFNFLNPFIHERKSSVFNDKNQLSASDEMLFTQNMTVQYNGTFINLLVAPGDSVHLEIDGSKLKEEKFKWLTISGSNAAVSTELNQWHHYFSLNHAKSFQPALSVSAMTDSINQCYRQYIQVLDSFSKATGMSKKTYDWALTDIKYTVSYFAADYLTTKDSNSGKISYNHSLYKDKLFDQYSTTGFASMMFPYHLMNYAYTLLQTDSLIRVNRQSGNYRIAAERAIRLILQEPKSISRDYILFSTLKNYLEASPFLLDSLKDTKSRFSQAITYRYLLRAEDKAKHPSLSGKPISGINFLDSSGEKKPIIRTEIFNYFNRTYPGKIIYLDVYATWCVPCLQEMEYTPALKKQVDTSTVVFINLCLQSSEKNWVDLIRKKNLTGENYFLDDDASKLFMGMYQVGGFPTYMLIDGKGKLVTKTAPRPSDSRRLLQLLTDTAKKQ